MERFSVKKPYTVAVGVIIVVILGIISFQSMTTDLLPSMDLPYIVVVTTYVGASPEEVERVVSKPLEARFATVSELKEISSNSAENVSSVILEFNEGADLNTAMIELNAKINQVSADWSDSVGTPIMTKINPDMLPVIVAAVDIEGMDILEMSSFVNQTLIGELESIDGVASVSASGLVEEEITVTIDQTRIDRLNSMILKEVDAELYEVEQMLLEGEEKLLDAKKALDKQGRAGLNQISEGLNQIDTAKQKIQEALPAMREQRETLARTLDEARANELALTQALASIPETMSEEQAAALAQLQTARDQRQAAQERLDEVNRQLALLEQTGQTDFPDQTEQPTQTETPLQTETPSQTDAPEPTDAPTKKPERETRVETPVEPTATAEPTTEPTPTSEPTATPESTSTPEPVPTEETRIEQSAQASNQEQPPETKQETPIEPELLAFSRVAYAAEATQDALSAEKARLEQTIAALDPTIQATEESYQQLLQLQIAIEGRPEMVANLALLQENIPVLESNLTMLDDTIAKLERGVIPGGYMEGIDEDTDIAQAEAALVEAQKTARKMIRKGNSQIADAQRELGEKRAEFEEEREKAFEEAKLDGVITVNMISQLIGAQNLSMPAGYLTEDGQEYLVRVGDEFTSVPELSNTLLFTMDLDAVQEVRLRDVADVEITNNADEVYAKLNGNDCVLLSFNKQSTYSTSEVTDAIQETFARLTQATPGLRLVALVDQGIYIDMIIDSVLENLVWGGALAILILLLFLTDYRPTLVIAISIPASVVAAFVTMYFTGITLNVMSLAGLALGVGMLVDNSIVVIENIYRLHGQGMPILPACVQGAKQMRAAITSSTLTTVCVFAPIVFVQGIARDLFTDMGLTITFSLLASLIVALTVVPAMSAAVLKRTKKRKHRVFTAIQRAYGAILSFTLRFKWPVLILCVALLVYSASFVMGMGLSFVPDVDSTQMTATLKLPDNCTFEEMQKMSNKTMDAILSVSEVDTVGVFNSENAALSLSSGANGSDSIAFYLQMREDKTRRNDEIQYDILDAIKPLGYDVSVKTSNMDITMLSGSGISAVVSGSDTDELRRIASDVANIMAGVEGTTDISDGQEKLTPEIRLTVDKEAATENNLTVGQVFQEIYTLVMDGVEVTTVTMDDRDYPVVCVNGRNLDLTTEELRNRTIEVEKGDETIQVRLGDICDIAYGTSLSTIARVNQTHTVTASCGVDLSHNVGLVGREIEARVAEYPVPDGYKIAISGESDTINQVLGDLVNMVLLAIALIFLIMVAQFQSFLMPFIVLFTIPLAMTGGLLALVFTGLELSVVAMLGFLVLAGVIVNNGIVFVDTVNQLRLEGMEKREALIETGKIRLRPILMTALTTILGMSTMSLGSGMGAEMLQPMAVVTIGGLTYGTFMTLFVVPALYDMFTKRRMKKREVDLQETPDAASKPVSAQDDIVF